MATKPEWESVNFRPTECPPLPELVERRWVSGRIRSRSGFDDVFDPQERIGPVTFRRIRISPVVDFSCIVLSEVAFEAFAPSGNLLIRGCLFDRVVMRGRLPLVTIQDVGRSDDAFGGPSMPSPDLYKTVPWALDIREAEPRELLLGGGLIPRDKLLFREDQVGIIDMRMVDAFYERRQAGDIGWPANYPICAARDAGSPFAYMYNDKEAQRLGTLSWLRDNGWAE